MRRKIFYGLVYYSKEVLATVVTAGVAQASRPDERAEIEKVGESRETDGRAGCCFAAQLRLASVIGSVFLGAVTSLLRTLEYRVGSASSECGWLARRLEGRSKGVRRERVRKLDGSMRRSDEVRGETDDLKMEIEMEIEMEMERWMVDGW